MRDAAARAHPHNGQKCLDKYFERQRGGILTAARTRLDPAAAAKRGRDDHLTALSFKNVVTMTSSFIFVGGHGVVDAARSVYLEIAALHSLLQ
jgi:hypothetical protein